jgi:hypothetical protein
LFLAILKNEEIEIDRNGQIGNNTHSRDR